MFSFTEGGTANLLRNDVEDRRHRRLRSKPSKPSSSSSSSSSSSKKPSSSSKRSSSNNCGPYVAEISNPGKPGVCDDATACGTVKISCPDFKSDYTLVEYDLAGLRPGLHGLHIHEKPITSDCVSTGGHWNPQNNNHGSNLDAQRHFGDLGNILVGANGNATGTLLANIPVNGKYSLEDSQLSVVIHELQDDLGRGGDDGSRRVGNAGGRPGCGNITTQS
ncbi:hypothetical protein ACA910_006756 [Epithemia clementina (nom. ined.)]